jgi:hypothetical protein
LRPSRSRAFAWIAAVVLATGLLRADDRAVVAPWTGLGRNAWASFTGFNAAFPLSALAGSFLIIRTGLDTGVHNFFARNTFMEGYSRPAVHVGSYLPAVLGAGLLVSGLAGRDSKLATAGSAAMQAAVLGLCTTVGREFRRRYDGGAEKPSGVSTSVMPGRFALTICFEP